MSFPFPWLNKRFESLLDFERYLYATYPIVPSWIKRYVFHNTYRPDKTQWGGSENMRTLGKFYQDKGWSAGPNLFVASGTKHDGVYIGTPLHLPGIHAGACNDDGIGVEHVGDFDRDTIPYTDLVYYCTVSAIIHRWANMNPMNTLVLHKDCMPGRTCPGKHTDRALLRETTVRIMQSRQPISTDIWSEWGIVYPLPIEARNHGIPQEWLKTYKSGYNLGQAVSPSIYDATGSGNCVQMFQRGAIVFIAKTNKLNVLKFD